MINLFLASAQAAAATSDVSKQWLIWLCVGLTLFLAFGLKLLKKIVAFNKKHHILGWDEGKEIKIEWKEQRFD